MNVLDSRWRGLSRSTRRLAAILAADVAGYSRLIGEDESVTLALLAARRAEMDRCIAAHGGRIANTAGDSVLAEFGSVVEAVACALAVQRTHAAASEAVARERQVRFRIGVHIGDIVVRDGDLFGNGVNIAARLEALAAAGGIALSDQVRAEVRGRFDVELIDGGAVSLKNIRDRLRVWRIAADAPVARPEVVRPGRDAAAWRCGIGVASAGALAACAVLAVGLAQWLGGAGDAAGVVVASGEAARGAAAVRPAIYAVSEPAAGAAARPRLAVAIVVRPVLRKATVAPVRPGGTPVLAGVPSAVVAAAPSQTAAPSVGALAPAAASNVSVATTPAPQSEVRWRARDGVLVPGVGQVDAQMLAPLALPAAPMGIAGRHGSAQP